MKRQKKPKKIEIEQIVDIQSFKDENNKEELFYELKLKNKSKRHNIKVNLNQLKQYLSDEELETQIYQFKLLKQRFVKNGSNINFKDKNYNKGQELSIIIEQEHQLFPLLTKNGYSKKSDHKRLIDQKPQTYVKFCLYKSLKQDLGLKNADSLNQNIPTEIINPSLYQHFSPPHKLNIWRGEEQSYNQYVQYIKQHQSILKVQTNKNVIKVYQIQPIENENFQLNQVIDFLRAYFPNLNFQIQKDFI